MEANKEKITDSLYGAIVGDALGVPVEFYERSSLTTKPVKDMIGYGSHNQPPGTWSDDSSMMLATLDSLIDGYDIQNIMTRFTKWLNEGYMTPHGSAFDVGITTQNAIGRFCNGASALNCGLSDEYSNGNGSLMRILPLSLYVHCENDDDIIQKSFEVSKLTHAHIRSQLCCAYFSLIVKMLLQDQPISEAMDYANAKIESYTPANERQILKRVLTKGILKEDLKNIKSSGYVVDTLEAALWCCESTNSFKDAVLKAVNLGDDTDTVGTVTGALAGIIYGQNAIPSEWIQSLAKIDEIDELINRFVLRTLAGRI